MQNDLPSEFVAILPSGSLAKVSFNVRQLATGDQLLASLSEEAIVLLPNLFPAGPGSPVICSAKSYKGKLYVTVPLPGIRVRTTYAPEGDAGKFVPVFQPPSRVTGGMVLEPFWTPPKGCKVRLMVQLADNRKSEMAFLAAFDADGRQYRLPLPNTHAEGRLCEGDYDRTKSDAQTAIANTLSQFDNSSWNADLAPSAELSKAMFSVKIVDGKTEQVPLPKGKSWTDYCAKNNSDFTKLFIV